MSSTERRFSDAQRRVLLAIARDSIEHGLHEGEPLRLHPEDFDPLLAAPGSLEAYRPLVTDVAENAFAAAFRDPRFPPLSPAELDDLDIQVSVLSPPEPLEFDSEADLLAKIRPGIDGLIIEDLGHRGTFLPSVWESLPEPELFWRHLKQKAGLPPDHWSPTLRVYRYTTESFSKKDVSRPPSGPSP